MKASILTLTVLSIFLAPVPTQCARILGIFPFPFKSHMVVFSALTKELARRGHELVVVSTFPLSKPMANYTDINIMPEMTSQYEFMVGDLLYRMNNDPPFTVPLALWSMGLQNMELFVNSQKIKDLLHDTRGFDLVISEAFMNEPVYGFAHHFKAPLVIVPPFGGFHWLNYGPGNPAPPFYMYNGITCFDPYLSFYDRVINTIFMSLWNLGQELYYKPRQDAFRKELFGTDSPSVWELERSVSLTFSHNHITFNYPRPLVPSVVEVGGMHVMSKNNKLPEDIQKFLDGATNGAIYFSMGSNLRGDQMPPERRQAFLDAFSTLPQRVLWKWESDSLPGQPSNVKLGKWLPQQDILAHPNVNLFIAHGGLLGAQEAIYHGVPLVAIPIFGDQGMNVRNFERSGFAVRVEMNNVTKESILWAINRAMQPDIQRAAKHRSKMYRDQPESPLDRAVFWTEYVLRHNGAPHMRSAATQLSWYQLYLLDVIAAILVVLILFMLVIRSLIMCICCRNIKQSATGAKKYQ